jgi:hypothetical protein
MTPVPWGNVPCDVCKGKKTVDVEQKDEARA